MAIKTPLAIDRTVALDINGSTQRLRMCAERVGLPPLLVVQAGPGLPVLHEVAKFQRRLSMERDCLVSYWEQRGCGAASKRDAGSVSLHQQVDDLRAVLRWLRQETNQRTLVLGISLGGAIALQAVAEEHDHVAALIVVSPDAQTSSSDASVYEFLQAQSASAGNRRLSARVMKLGKPPYTDSAAFQGRASLLTDLGTIERGKTFNGLVRETLFAMIGTYGLVGTVAALRNLNLVQRKLLPELVSLDLLTNPPRLASPVHYVFGAQDALTPAAMVKQLPAVLAAPVSTIVLVPNAGHMVHFDQPEVVRSVLMSAINRPEAPAVSHA